jgi:hypothetical protein
MVEVPTAIARELWSQGLPALHDVIDAALDPSRQLDAVARLGLPDGFCPDLAVLVFQFWPIHDVADGRPQTGESHEPRPDAPRVLQVKLQTHGGSPLIAKWRVVQRSDGPLVVPEAPWHAGGSQDAAPSMAATALKPSPRPLTVRYGSSDEELEAMQLPTYFVQSPPLNDCRHSGWERVWLNDPVLVRLRVEDSQVAKVDTFATSFVRLDAVDGLIVPTFYGDNEARPESFLIRGTTMWVYAGERPIYKIVVIQPLKGVPSGP